VPKIAKTLIMKGKFTIVLILLMTFILNAQETKYISASELNIREGAGKNYNIVAKAFRNEKVTIISEQGNWSEIETESGIKGYVSSNFLTTKIEDGNSEKWKFNKIYIAVLVIIIYLLYKKIGTPKSLKSENYQKNIPSQKKKIEENKTSTSSSWKVCSTCERWAGSRQPSHWRDRSEHLSGVKGECVGGYWNRSQRDANSSCHEWKLWNILKK
jgi:uncharacterized protein YraI